MKTSMLRLLAASALISCAALALPAKAANVNVDGDLKMLCGTATGSAAASTLANKCGVITTESLTTAAGAIFTETITNTYVASTDICVAQIVASPGAGTPIVQQAVPTTGVLTIKVQNIHASAALNNTIGIGFACFRP